MNEYMKMMGCKAKDKVSGFVGIVTSISFDLYGCVQVVLSPEVGQVDKKLPDGHWFDAKRLEVIRRKPVMEVPSFEKPKGEEIGPASKPERHAAKGFRK